MISTHILDTAVGDPAANVQVKLEKRVDHDWQLVGEDKTNDDGRIAFDCPKEAGYYRLLFDVEDYYTKQKVESFYLRVPVVFNITDTSRKYHVPLLLNPFGYSTYRGS